MSSAARAGEAQVAIVEQTTGGGPLRSVIHQRILVLLDGSEPAEQVLPHVAALIRPRQTRLFLLSVITTRATDRMVAVLTSYPPGLQLSTTALSRAEADLQLYLRSVAVRLRERGATVHTEVRRGRPAEEILAHAEEIGADLIAMTTHGRSGLRGWVFGSVADRVLRVAPCPVLLVRAETVKEGEGRECAYLP